MDLPPHSYICIQHNPHKQLFDEVSVIEYINEFHMSPEFESGEIIECIEMDEFWYVQLSTDKDYYSSASRSLDKCLTNVEAKRKALEASKKRNKI